jgi:deazaflavin-dependent oxidoreductase (nitroreductase family)
MMVDRPESQAARRPVNPPRWLIPRITRIQVWLYERSEGRIGARVAGMNHLLLHTIGRRSGRASTVCLPYWCDAEGRRIVVASYGGAPRHPAWYHNLADRAANPEVLVRDRDRRFWCVAEVAKGSERDDLWDQLVSDRPFYTEYQSSTERTIPLIRLVEARPFAA